MWRWVDGRRIGPADRLAGKPDFEFALELFKVDAGHREAAEVLVDFRMGAGTAAGYVDFGLVGFQVGTVGCHRDEVREERLVA